ncbi:MAG: class I SAM-dependent methyltransferase [Comamonas sp.]
MNRMTDLPAQARAEDGWLLPAALMEPYHLTHPAPWAGHIPFAAWLMAVAQPRSLVELGAYSGISYLAFCQAIAEQGLMTRTYAIDTWEGDAHAGAYGEGILASLRQAHDPHYTQFSTLMRMRFDEALPSFADGSVDVLHIDGLHTYEAVRHDFETWLPKLSERGVVLFHDSNVHRDDFGVHQLWAELQGRYSSIHFPHSNGLGVLLVGAQQPALLRRLCDRGDAAFQREACRGFATLGARLEAKAELMALQHALGDKQQQIQSLEAAGQQRHSWIEKLDGDIRTLELERQQLQGHLEAAQTHALQNQNALEQAQNQSQWLSAQWESRQQQQDIKLLALQQEAAQKQWQIEQQAQQMQALARKLSPMWQITDLLRKGKRVVFRLKQKLAPYEPAGLRRVRHALRRKMRQARGAPMPAVALLPGSNRHYGILATAHTQFVAHALAQVLRKAGFEVSLLQDVPAEGFGLDMYIVVCPQMFKQLPPGEKRIVFQMEQSVSPRWFTDEYLAILENSLSAWDYAPANLAFLETKGIRYPHTFLVPIGGVEAYSQLLQDCGEPALPAVEPSCDVLFYGDVNAPRRQEMLQALQRHFSVRIEGNLFGDALRQAVRQARVVVNIHYYEGALLETTRVYECLSLGTPVVTESSADIHQHAALLDNPALRVTPVGDAQAMVLAVQEMLQQQAQAPALVQQGLTEELARSGQQFEFMVLRALYALGRIDTAQWEALTVSQPLPGRCMVLSMPETVRRRAHFVEQTLPGLQTEVAVFDGVRYSPGWLGCAMSYQYLARKALQTGVAQLEIMEDDVEMPPDYAQRRARVDGWLAAHDGQWDIFAGLIAKIHPGTQVLEVMEQDGETFVVLDRMTSMVHNIYAQPALEALSEWNSSIRDPHTNTIDSYLQGRAQMRVITTLPFLVAHTTDMDSSLWGINNQEYLAVIYKAEQDLRQLVERFKQAQAA